ncbi:acyltransferase [Candidatus Micrarchaeota archaeon]|nr:acyltransferase [Candidatus Micrarchaeota archaeon]
MKRSQRLERHATQPPSLRQWHRVRNPLRIAVNFIVIYACRFLPSLSLKNFFYRLLGAKIGKNASFGLGSTIDVFFPELVEVGENATIGYNTLLMTHEFLCTEWRKGRVRIGKNALIGANCTVLPGVEIGEGAVVSACSLANKNVPLHAFWGGVPAREIRKSF